MVLLKRESLFLILIKFLIFLILIDLALLCVCVCVRARVCARARAVLQACQVHVSIQRPEGMSEPQKVELQVAMNHITWCWERSCVPLTTEPSLLLPAKVLEMHIFEKVWKV